MTQADPKTSRRLTNRAALLYAAVWVPAAMMAFSLKRKLLTDEGGGFDFVADAMGVGDGSRLSLLQRLSLYRWDLLVTLVVIPLLWVWCLTRVRPVTRLVTTLLASSLTTLVLFVELKTYWEVGTFLPAEVLAAGAFGAGRAFLGEYMQTASVLKLVALLGATICVALAAYLVDARGYFNRGGTLGLRSTLAVAAIGILGAFMPPRLPETPFNRSGISVALREFAGLGRGAPKLDGELTGAAEQLMGAYRTLTGAPVPNEASPFFGAAKGYNVLVYLYETLPFACEQRPRSAEALVHLTALKRTAFVAQSHYATYPYSRRAYFSIYSGWYPSHGMRDFTEELKGRDSLAAPGMVQGARTAGYATMAFVPEVASEWENDVIRYKALGFDQHVVPSDAELWRSPRDSAELRVAWQRKRDDESRGMLIREVTKLGSSGRPWFASFNPQITHGPWPGAAAATDEAQICDTGLELFREVDAGLGQILAALDATGQRDRTIVVALGDHGLRTRKEYPLFKGATLDDITFHVPMIISVPGVLREPREIGWPTSHVDIAPSVLDLLGVARGRGMEQGSPMWDEQLATRRIFIYAQGYLGADGYIDADRAVMMNYLLGGVAQTRWNGTLRFRTADILAGAGSDAGKIAEMMFRSVAIQRAFTHRMVGAAWDSVLTPGMLGGEDAAPVALPVAPPPRR